MVQSSTKGLLYYWAIAAGLLAGLAFALIVAIFDLTSTDNLLVTVGLGTLLVTAFIAYLIVALEIWDRFGALAAIAAYVVFPVSVVYWAGRIRGLGTGRS